MLMESFFLPVECRTYLQNPGYYFISCIKSTITLFNILFRVKKCAEKFQNDIFIPFQFFLES